MLNWRGLYILNTMVYSCIIIHNLNTMGSTAPPTQTDLGADNGIWFVKILVDFSCILIIIFYMFVCYIFHILRGKTNAIC